VSRLKIFENRALRIFGAERDEVIGGWRKLHIMEFHNFYSSPHIIRMMRMRGVGHVACMGEV
jgi:hypothetical protein